MAYMKDSTGKRLDTFEVVDAAEAKKSAAGLRRNSASIFRGMIPIARRAVNLGTGNQSNGTDTSGMYRRCHPILVDCAEIRLVFSNYYGANAAFIADGPNDITVQAAVELPVSAATFTQQASFRVKVNGLTTFTVPAGAEVVSDPIPYTGKAGQLMYVQTYVSVASAGMRWPTSFTALGNGMVGNMWEGGATGAPTTNLVGTTGNGPTGLVGTYGPSAIVGTPSGTTLPKVAYGFGDSIMYGSGDNTALWEGWFGRACANQNIPYVNVSHPGEQVAQVQGIYARHRLPYAVGADFAITNYGRNDLANVPGITVATFQANLLAWWTQLAARGLRVYQTTVTPKALSTDTWMTVANQAPDTANSYEANRVTVNTWLRDGAPTSSGGAAVAAGTVDARRMGAVGHPLTGIIDVADMVETARNSGKFKVGRLVNDAAATAGTRTITSATAAFTSADVGSIVTLAGAGASGATMTGLRILTVDSPTQITYDGSAAGTITTTISGQAMAVGSWTADGTHPTTNAYASIAAAVNLSAL